MLPPIIASFRFEEPAEEKRKVPNAADRFYLFSSFSSVLISNPRKTAVGSMQEGVSKLLPAIQLKSE